MRYIIEDNTESNSNYIKTGEVGRSDFIKLLVNELDAYVESMLEPITVEVNGVSFIVKNK